MIREERIIEAEETSPFRGRYFTAGRGTGFKTPSRPPSTRAFRPGLIVPKFTVPKFRRALTIPGSRNTNATSLPQKSIGKRSIVTAKDVDDFDRPGCLNMLPEK